MKSTTRMITSGMLVLSLMQTTLASVPVNGAGQIELASLDVVRALESDGVVNGHDREVAINMNAVVGGQLELDSGCWTCFGISVFLLALIPPMGLATGFGCAVACLDVF